MKIICIGKNYAAHAKEMKSDVPENPVFFLKPETAVLRGEDFYFPDFTQNLHHEIEVVFRIGKNGKYIDPKYAHTYLSGFGIGIDFTARDLQDKAKQKGLPWEIAKAFDNSAVVSEILPMEDCPDPDQVDFHLNINGNTVQKGNTSGMVFPVASIISYVSQFITLKKGDLIFTGTPEGVGPVKVGDQLEGFLGNKKMFEVKVK